MPAARKLGTTLLVLVTMCQAELSFSLDAPPALQAAVSEADEFTEYFHQGERLQTQGDFQNAVEEFRKALVHARKNQNNSNQIAALIQLGILHWNTGDLDDSQAMHKQALAVTARTDKKERQAEIQTYLEIHRLYQAGKSLRDQGLHTAAAEQFEKAIALAQESGSEEYEVKCLRQLIVTHADIDEADALFPLTQKALDLARKLNHKKEEGRGQYHIGLFYDAKGNFAKALLHYHEALAIAREIKDHFDESYCLTNISHIYIQLGNYDKALEYLQDVLKIDRMLNEDEYVAIDLNNIGVTYHKKGVQSQNRADLDNALIYFEESRKIASRLQDLKTEIQALTNIGMVYLDLEKFSEAMSCFFQGLEYSNRLQDKEEMANLLVNIGMVNARRGDYTSTIDYCQRAVQVIAGAGGEVILWEAYFEMAMAFRALQDFRKSLDCYRKSVNYLDRIRSQIQLEELKASYLGTDKRIDTYYNLIDLLAYLNEIDPGSGHDLEAFYYLERAKARAFLDRLEVSQVNIIQTVDRDLLIQEEKLMTKISYLNGELFKPGISVDAKKEIDDQIKQLEGELETLRRKIRMSSPAYADLKYPQIISLSQVQDHLLDHKTAFFEYCLRENHSYVFVITKKDLKIIPLPPAHQIQSQVKSYLSTITDAENHDFRIGYELFDALVKPGLDGSLDKLIFIPDDILHYLPFETLLNRDYEHRWLVQDYKIAYAPSLTSLREIIHRKSAAGFSSQKDILAVGDPCFGASETLENTREISKSFDAATSLNLPRLRFSGQEIEKIAGMFDKTDILKREDATEGQFKQLDLSEYKILHLATHCLIDNQNPDRSSIVFSLGDTADKVEDGFLQMREIFQLRLNSDLVTLSSCQTGLGQFIKGEGIESLSRAFFYAGASSTLISLWAVHDQATSQFMERVYYHLRSSHSIMDSLQKTKLEMIESGTLSHPYYWAGFVATGNSVQVIFKSGKARLFFFLFLLLLLSLSAFLIYRKSKKV